LTVRRPPESRPSPYTTLFRSHLVGRPGDGVAVRAGGGFAEQPVHRLLDGGGDDVLPLAGLGVGVGPRQVEDVGEEALGEAVPAQDRKSTRLNSSHVKRSYAVL